MTTILDEEELIKTRLLLFEQRPYNRLLKRCSTLFKSEQVPHSSETIKLFCEELELDFKAFESILVRTQLVHNTNKRECERYEEEKGNILRTAESARGVIVSLRETLAVSQMEKENKLVYDAIATDILSRPGLKTRQEQQGNLDRLNKEIAELESERDEYRLVLAARRDRFSQIVDQLEKMWAQIKEDKDEQDRREGMSEEEEEEGEEIEGLVRATPAPELHTPSNASATPKPEARSRSPSILVTRTVPDEKEEGEDTEGGEDIELTDALPEQNHKKEEGGDDHDEMDISQE